MRGPRAVASPIITLVVVLLALVALLVINTVSNNEHQRVPGPYGLRSQTSAAWGTYR